MKKKFVVLVSFLFVLSCSDKKNVETDLDSNLEYEIDIIDEIEEVDDDIAINENDDNTDVDLEPEFPLDGCRNEETEDKYQSFEVKKNGFLINGNFVLLRGGTIQYFRLPAEEWENRIISFKKAGFNTVDIYVAWNIHEPSEGVYNFKEPDLALFLELIKKHGLYAYFRPGPYICNEFKNGGIPSWLMTKTTKKSKDSDGLVNLRTDDPDYLEYVEKYFEKLNEVVKPYLISNGGPIILYSLENEHNYLEMFIDIDKLFWYDGGPERGITQGAGTKEYFTALKNIVKKQGIDVPLSTCPGVPETKGMGEVSDIIPMPNFYDKEGVEKLAFNLMKQMHDNTQNNGIYSQFPSATTESNRLASQMLRLFAGGLDGYFAFNIAGMQAEGYNNTVVIDPGGLDKIVDISAESIRTAFLNPTIGYFSNVVDYFGAITPSGLRRDKFFNFRRVNFFLDTFEEAIGAELYPLRTAVGLNEDGGRLKILNEFIGTTENNTKTHYWFSTESGTNFIFLTNESTENVYISKGQINLDGLKIPKYTSSMVVPVEIFGGSVIESEDHINSINHKSELYSTHVLVTNAKLDEKAKLNYSTSQIMTVKDLGCTKLLVFYGLEDSSGEISLSFFNNFKILHQDLGVITEFEDDYSLDISFKHKDRLMTVIELDDGTIYRILVTTQNNAGKIWFEDKGQRPFAVSGLYDFEYDEINNEYKYIADQTKKEIYTVSNYPLDIAQTVKTPFDEITGVTVYSLPKTDIPLIDGDIVKNGKTHTDTDESLIETDDSLWAGWSGEPQDLDSFGIHEGHAWYRTEFELPENVNVSSAHIYIQHASDIVGIYVNGSYLNTVCPLGTEIDSKGGGKYGFDSFGQHLVPGRNVISFRVEIWGHGSFMWPRGKLVGLGQMPDVGVDAVKGLRGKAELIYIDNGSEKKTGLNKWSVSAGTGGENKGWQGIEFDDSKWDELTIPLELKKGEVVWYRTEFDSSDIPDTELFLAPVSFKIKGKNAKATLFLNGRLIGRWLSDSSWLERGTWTRSVRNMWSEADPDIFPLPAGIINEWPNSLVLLFEDSSGGNSGEADDFKAGSIEELSIILNQEEKNGTSFKPITGVKGKLSF